MTDRYVGPGGSDSNNGLSWANRKLTLTGVEDTPVTAGDTVYVGPGVYREQLTLDVSGSSGNEIEYVGDVTGEHTDGVGGFVRITGLDTDDDMSPTRAWLIDLNDKNYRVFRGFVFDSKTDKSTGYIKQDDGVSPTYIVFEDCVFCPFGCETSNASRNGSISFHALYMPDPFYLRRCVFLPSAPPVGSSNFNDSAISTVILENNLCMGFNYLEMNRYDVVFRNNTIMRSSQLRAGWTGAGTAKGYDNVGIYAFQLTWQHDMHWTEDYNLEFAEQNSILNGANDLIDKAFYHQPEPLLAGYILPHDPTQVINIGSNTHLPDYSSLTEDLHGLERLPNGKDTRGAFTYKEVEYGTTYRSGDSSIKLADAGRHIIPFIVDSNRSYKITVYVYRESDYAGTLPEIQIRRVGQSAVVVTDTGSAGQWNKLTTTVNTGDNDKFIHLEYFSQNTASSGDYACYFDDLTIKVRGGGKTHRWITNEMLMTWVGKESQVDVWVLGSNIPMPAAPVQERDEPSPLPTYYRRT